MKSSLTIILLILSVNAQATSILDYKTVYNCETAQKVQGSEMLVKVDEAQDGQSQVSLKMSGEEAPLVIQTKKISPPPMMAGGSIKYETLNPKTDDQIELAVGTLPVRLGQKVGKVSKFSVIGLFEDLSMVCFPESSD